MNAQMSASIAFCIRCRLGEGVQMHQQIIDIRVNERDWKLPFAAGNASYPIPQIF